MRRSNLTIAHKEAVCEVRGDRVGTPMIIRFSEATKRLFTLAEDEAEKLGYDHIDEEQVLLALLRDPRTRWAVVLNERGVTYERVKACVKVAVKGPGASHAEQTGVSRTLKTVLMEWAYQEAGALDHTSIEPAHVLLALLNLRTGEMPGLVAAAGVDVECVRARVLESLGGGPAGSAGAVWGAVV